MKSATMIEPFCLGPKVKADTDGGRGAALAPVMLAASLLRSAGRLGLLLRSGMP